MKTLSNYSKFLLGTNDNQPIYLSPPSWDCGWYWGFGYLGNKNCHYHLSGLTDGKNQNLFDALKEHFGDSFVLKSDSDIWTFCELVETAYLLKETAEVLGRGGSHYSTNPCKDLIINHAEVERINNIVLPQIFEEICKLLTRAHFKNTLTPKLLNLVVNGDTQQVLNFMAENNINIDEIIKIKGITSHDYNIIHSLYWKNFHAAKNAK